MQFSGESLLNRKPHEINQIGVSRVFQTPEIFGELTLLENVLIPALASRDGAFKLNAWSRLQNDKDLQAEGMERLRSVNLEDAADRRAAELSRGDKRRLELAMCLIQNPKLLLLDEPTAGMSRADTNDTIDLMKQIAETGVTMVVIEHDMHVVFSLAQKVSVLAQGHVIVEDLPENIKGNKQVQDAYLGGAHL